MGDEDKNKEGRKSLTQTELRAIIADVAKETVESTGLVKRSDLKGFVEEMVAPMVTAQLKPALDEGLKQIAKMPAVGSARDIINSGDGAYVGLKPSGYGYMAEFARDVMLAGKQEKSVGGAPPSKKFFEWNTQVNSFRQGLEKVAGSPTMEIGDPDVGGYLVPPEHSAKILDKGFESSKFLNLCTKIPMLRYQIDMPYIDDFSHSSYLFGNMMAYWGDELGEKTATKPKFGKVTLRLNKMFVMVFSSDELLEDSIISLEPFLTDKAAKVIGWKSDEAIIRGTGAGQPKGLLAGTTPRVTVPKETGQAAATIVYQNVLKMFSRLWSGSQDSSVWVGNKQIVPQLGQMSLAVGTGGSAVYLPAGGLSGKPYTTLMGSEIIFTEHASALGTEGDLMYCDFSQYLVGQKAGGGGIQFAKSIHLYFLYDQTAFRYVIRFDGQPWWPSVYTPKRGDTESPFVTLAVRA